MSLIVKPMKKFLLTIIILLFVLQYTPAQIINLNSGTINRESGTIDSELGTIVPGKVIEGDTVLHVFLRQITIKPPYKFKSRRERRRYSRLVRYVKKVYPYSQIIKVKLYEIHSALDTIETERKKKAYIKQKEAELKDEFEGQLRRLTFTQGRILIKLVDRETGATTYAVIKELKGSMSAFFWQSVARLFGSNLKSEYDAAGDDKMIEDIIIRIENGQL